MNQAALTILVENYLVLFLNRRLSFIVLFALYWIGRIFPPVFYYEYSSKNNSSKEETPL
jgi:hypothetical protein